jgi:hypothetical protein
MLEMRPNAANKSTQFILLVATNEASLFLDVKKDDVYRFTPAIISKRREGCQYRRSLWRIQGWFQLLLAVK